MNTPGVRVQIATTAAACGAAAAEHAAGLLRAALAARGSVRLTVATGASQFALYDHLVAAPGIAWSRVTVFHLDEYVGLPAEHPASFRRYLRERFLDRLPEPVGAFHELDGTAADPHAECARLGNVIAIHPVDVLLCGIGENGHLAFNDPPADFTTVRAFHVVALDDACRRQQVGEGWFPSLDAVPTHALSMTVPQMLRAGAIVCTVPDRRKAAAVRATLEGPRGPDVPASALRGHHDVALFLDEDSASLLSRSAADA